MRAFHKTAYANRYYTHSAQLLLAVAARKQNAATLQYCDKTAQII